MTNKELLEYCCELETRINDIRYDLDRKADKIEIDGLREAIEAEISVTDIRLSALESTRVSISDIHKAKKELLATPIEIFERMYEEI